MRRSDFTGKSVAPWHDRVRENCLSTLDKRDMKLFFQKVCFIQMMGGSRGLQGLFWEAGMHLICFSTPLSIDSSALLLGTIKFLAAETEIAAGFP